MSAAEDGSHDAATEAEAAVPGRRAVDEVRPFQRGDLAEVAALYELVMRSGAAAPRAGARVVLEPIESPC
jgi:hypothetical protein